MYIIPVTYKSGPCSVHACISCGSGYSLFPLSYMIYWMIHHLKRSLKMKHWALDNLCLNSSESQSDKYSFTRPLLRPKTKLQSHFHQKHVFCNFPVNDSAHAARCWHLTRCSRGWAKNSCAECLFIMFFGIICTLTPYSTIYGWQFFKNKL